MSREMPEQVKNNLLIRKKIWNRVHKQNKNFVGAFTGDVGDGKSYGAITLAQILDPNFSVDKIAFTPEQFLDLVRQDYPEGSVIVLEEGGVNADNRNFWKEANKQINYVLETWRHQNRICLITLPSLGGLDKKVTGRLHAYIDMKTVDHSQNISLGKYYEIDQKAFKGKIIRRFPVLEYPETHIKKIVKWLKFRPPGQDLREKYEELQAKYKDEVVEKGFEKIKEENEKKKERSATEIAEEIINDDELFESFKKTNHSQKFLKKSLIGEHFNISGRKAKRVKDVVYDEIGLDEKENWI